MTTPQKHHGPALYRIRLKGVLGNQWSGWFQEMAVSSDGRDTVLSGQVADQAALHGLLLRIRDLNLSLLSVECIEADLGEQQ